MAVRDVQIASAEAFESEAKDLLAAYTANLNSYIADISNSDYRPNRGDAERERECAI